MSESANSGTPVVLVVEDEWFVRADIADQLRDAGFVILEAESGKRAFDFAGNGHAIDIVFTGIRLGGEVNGWDVGEAKTSTPSGRSSAARLSAPGRRRSGSRSSGVCENMPFARRRIGLARSIECDQGGRFRVFRRVGDRERGGLDEEWHFNHAIVAGETGGMPCFVEAATAVGKFSVMIAAFHCLLPG